MSSPTETLIFGAGWIGHLFRSYLPNSEITAVDITNPKAVEAELDRVSPRRVINCAAKTGRPNIDSCEENPGETHRVNVAGAILLAEAARSRGIHLTHMSSGCIYEGDNGGSGFSEDDPPNFLESVYARSKYLAEVTLKDLGVLQLRIRMPISATPDPRNLLTKLAGFKKVFHMANSVTILEDFLPAAKTLIEQNKTGIFHLVNEGPEFHDEVLHLYRETVDPSISFSCVDFEDLRKGMKTGRSNCLLSARKSREAGAAMPPFAESIEKILRAYAKAMKHSD